ncbi:DUF1275 domain-containing protein [Tissierella pigra]|uniref:DUF1275 domain-containing protein n=1 Tax=Tissierella pigra TaxID=2607614 RepID=A0A6N7XG40_9FIRM|nr:YoaK family protein [Tissierella pigra]MBU5427466.1 DUF1275 domain-containing protein [Tissierella pigra]MSU01011.1 DUF1275 domain-containing protein [Tissierella pigra]
MDDCKSKIKISTQINIIGFILITMAGCIDTVGIKLFLDESPAFLTGRGIILGYSIFKRDFGAFTCVLIVILAFIIGACISTIITRKMGLTGGLCFTGILIAIAAFPVNLSNITIATIIIPMAMGGQNAATSLTAINRTTHLTGPATDIGINIAKGNWNIVAFWILRWIGFPLGSVIGFHLVHTANNNIINIPSTLLLPAIIIILTGIIQKLTFDIPLLKNI